MTFLLFSRWKQKAPGWKWDRRDVFVRWMDLSSYPDMFHCLTDLTEPKGTTDIGLNALLKYGNGIVAKGI